MVKTDTESEKTESTEPFQDFATTENDGKEGFCSSWTAGLFVGILIGVLLTTGILFINGDHAVKLWMKYNKAPAAKPGPLLFDPQVKQLATNNFTSVLNAAPQALVMFYAPWCGHCKNAKQPFSEAAVALNGAEGKVLGAVDCTVHGKLCKQQEVKGYPTINVFEKGKFVKKFTGQRSKEGFLSAFTDTKKTKKDASNATQNKNADKKEL